jgi:hypothetical protein
MFLRNVGIYVQVHKALQRRRPTTTIQLFGHIFYILNEFTIAEFKNLKVESFTDCLFRRNRFIMYNSFDIQQRMSMILTLI